MPHAAQQAIPRQPTRHIGIDIAMHEKTVAIAIKRESDVMMANVRVIRMAEKLGMSAVECTMCGTAVSELATNIIRYAGKGEILLHCEANILHVTAQDRGPGIANVELAMQEGHSAGGGLGMGLSGVARIMDSMDIETTATTGTQVMVSKAMRTKEAKRETSSRPERLQGKPPQQHNQRLDHAIHLRPFPGEHGSGDGALALDIPSYLFMALWDVSGHGEQAHELSQRVERFIRSHSNKEPHVLLRNLHDKFRGTRGLVAVLARLSPSSGWLEYAGIGNVALVHLHEHGMRRLPLQEGVIGYQIRTPKTERLQLRKSDTLIMHSDGIGTIRKQLEVFKHTSATQLATNLIDNFRAKQVDDACCLVLRYRA